jgi:hypothetical protein
MPDLSHSYDFVVIGGGLAGIAAAVTAARAKINTALICDRPCLGGNASKEILISPVGAHQRGASFAYPRETGLLEELMLENLNNNRQGNPELWDLNLQTLVYQETNLDLYLNLVIQNVRKDTDDTRILSLEGYSLECDNWHIFNAALFADCSGNGTVAFVAGVPFMRGVESKEIFHEGLAEENYQKRELGCGLRFRAKDIRHPVSFAKPGWVRFNFTEKDFEQWELENEFRKNKGGFWWIEWGGTLDTIGDMSYIRRELTSIIYAIWHYLKNDSPMRDELATYDLDWVGTIAGCRENRRFVGDYILTQTDIDEQHRFVDSVAYGGWCFDDHPPEGFFSKSGTRDHPMHRGPYNIPLRCLYSSKIENLFLAGRNVSVSHIALTSTRVMNTCFQMGEAVGAAAAVCIRKNILPREAAVPPAIRDVQENLILSDHTILGKRDIPLKNLLGGISVSASSTLKSPVLQESRGTWRLSVNYMIMFPVITDHLDSINIYFDVESDTELNYSIRGGQEYLSTTPGEDLKQGALAFKAGKKVSAILPVNLSLTAKGWYFVELRANENLALHYGIQAPVGLKTLRSHDLTSESGFINAGHTNWKWDIIKDLETEPCGLIEISPAQHVYEAENVLGTAVRPDFLPNIWISGETDFEEPQNLDFLFEKPENPGRVDIIFDSSLDNPVLAFSSEYNPDGKYYSFNRIPSLVKHYRVFIKTVDNEDWRLIAEETDNYQRLRRHNFSFGNLTALRLSVVSTNGWKRAQVYGVRIFRSP